MNYLAHLVILSSINVLVALGIALPAGPAGYVSVAHTIFFAIGAYVAALLLTSGHSFALAVIVGVLLALAASVLVSWAATRTSGDQFVIATFALQIVALQILLNWSSVTRGPLGIAAIPHPSLGPWHIDSYRDFVLLAVGAALVATIAWARLSASGYGRLLRCLREDRTLAEVLGWNTASLLGRTIALSAVPAAFAGAVFATYIGFVSPAAFDFNVSVILLTMVLVGGADSRWSVGPAIGVIMLTVIGEGMRFLVPATSLAFLRQAMYGIVLILVVTLRPQGLFGRYDFGLRRRST